MTPLHSRHVLLLLAAAGLAVLPHAAHLSPAVALWTVAVFCWRILGVAQPKILPNGIGQGATVLAGVGVLFGQFDHQGGAETGVAIFVVALSIKLLELNAKRDAQLVCYLALMLAGSEFLFSQHLSTAVYEFVVCWAVLAGLAAVNGDGTDLLFAVRYAGRLLAQALPVAGILFILFPRVELPTWRWLEQKKQAHTGIGEKLDPGSISDLALSPKLVFRVTFSDRIPPHNLLYWRGPVFSITNGSSWVIARNDFAQQFQDRIRFQGNAYRYTLLMEPQARNWVFALDMPADYDSTLRRNADYQLVSREKQGKVAEYALVSYPVYNTGYLTKTEYRQNLQLPGPPPERVADLVRALQGDESKPRDYIARVLNYFHSQEFRYSLRPPLMKTRFIETFLFEKRTGFCNHYAAAFVYLMRMAGIPSRIVAGYQGGEYNQVGRFLEVREANAHAWAEVWLDGRGWVRIDPTTAILPSRIEQPVNVDRQVESGAVSLEALPASQVPSGLLQFEQLLNSVDFQWERWVLRYDTANQSMVWSQLGIGSLFKSLFTLIAAVGLVLGLFGYLMFGSRQPEQDPELRLYSRFCRKLAKAGVRILPGEGPLAFGLRAKASIPQLAGQIDDITQLFIRLRYSRSASEGDLDRLKRRIKQISL